MKADRHRDVVKVANDLVARLDKPQETAFQPIIAEVMRNKAAGLAALGQHTEAAKECEAIIDRLGKDQDNQIRQIVAEANDLLVSVQRHFAAATQQPTNPSTQV